MFTDNTSHLTVAAAILLSLCSCGKSASTDAYVPVHSVYYAVPEASDAMNNVSYSAMVEEGKRINVSFKTGGQIRRLSAGEGDYVKKGQPLGYLDDEDYRLAVEQVTAQYDQMTAEIKRLDEMFARHNIAPNDYEKAKAGYEQLRTQLDMTRNKLAYTVLESPANGYVVERFLEEGEMTGAGTPVFTIVDNSALEVSLPLPADVYSRRHEIKSFTGRTAVTGVRDIPLEAISFIPDADNNSLYRLRLRIPASLSGELAPGMNMAVKLHYNGVADDADVWLPSRSVFDSEGASCVWVLNEADSTVMKRHISVSGQPAGGKLTVRGLNADERVVAAGVHHLVDGEKVNVIGDIVNFEKSVGL